MLEYSKTYSKTSESLFQYYRDEPGLNDNGVVFDFAYNSNDNNITEFFKFKENITGQIGDNGTKNVEIMVPLK